MATDWTSIKTEYVNGAEYPDLAKKYKVKEATLRQRASRHKWSQERQKASQAVTEKATSLLVESKASQLAKFNEDDVKIARALKQAAGTMMKNIGMPNDLRTIAGVFETAQRIGRIALGADSAMPDESETMNLPVMVMIERKSARLIRGVA
jgi:hypothetical protein